MAGRRRTGVVSLAGALAAAGVLAGVAVFTVGNAGCANAGEFVQRGGEVEFVGGCVDPADLPGEQVRTTTTSPAAVDRYHQVSP